MVVEKWYIKFPNGQEEIARLEKWSDNEWHIDFGCQMWNRMYKSRTWAVKHLEKSGYVRIA